MAKRNNLPQKKEIEVQRKKIRLEELILKGNTNQIQLSAALGVSTTTIYKWMKDIRIDWQEREIADLDEQRRFRVKQLEHVSTLAFNAFDRSRKSSEEVSLIEEMCPRCNGRGNVTRNELTEPCMVCSETGRIIKEKISVKQKPGDAAFLKVAIESIKEIGKIECIYPVREDNKLLLSATKVNGDVRERVTALYTDVPNDLLVEALATMDRVDKASKESKRKTIETESKRIEKDD